MMLFRVLIYFWWKKCSSNEPFAFLLFFLRLFSLPFFTFLLCRYLCHIHPSPVSSCTSFHPEVTDSTTNREITKSCSNNVTAEQASVGRHKFRNYIKTRSFLTYWLTKENKKYLEKKWLLKVAVQQLPWKTRKKSSSIFLS